MANSPSTYTPTSANTLERLAHAAARHVLPHDLLGSLRGLGLQLRTQTTPLELHGKRLFGTWDPVLRRIEVFGCNGQRADKDIVHSLGHELGHALFGSHQWPNAETEADRFADLWLAALGPERVRMLAQALREQAEPPTIPS